MADFTSEQLKENINKEYFNKFSLDVLKHEMFIPINKQDDALVVGIVDFDNRDKRNSILTKVILTTKLKPKVFAITKEQFHDLIEFCSGERPEEKQVFEQPVEEVKASPSPVIIEQVAETQPAPEKHARKRLGELLIDNGLITDEQLQTALVESKNSGTPIGSILVKMGFISVEQLRSTLSSQQGVASVESKDLQIDSSVIRLLPEDFIKDNKVVPISTDGKTIVVGMVNPNEKQILNDIIYLTGLTPYPLILTHIEYEKCIQNYFATKKETEKLIEEISQGRDYIIEDDIWEQLDKEFKEESNIVAKFAKSIITEAIEKNASDIHIEPRSGKYSIRYRIDGILIQALEVPSQVETQLMSRLKVLGKMNIAEHRKPQDGHFAFKLNNEIFDFRLNTMPVGRREKMVIRILKPEIMLSKEDRRITLKGATTEDYNKINQMITSPYGIILATGPTGSGKTTTLYSILNKLNNDRVNITTIEDPVEMKLEGINQVQVNEKAEITFASCMRTILRQDPDIIMVGEIRDYETLEAAINASLTGHLVLSTFHTNNASSTITRLIELGAAAYLISSTLVGIIAQRLVRKLCPVCKKPHNPTPEELRVLFGQIDEDSANIMATRTIYKAHGCERCNNTGYFGRLGVYEIMPVNREIKRMIIQSAAAYEIEEVALACGMKTLQTACLEAIINGETTIAEHLRVLGSAIE